MIPSPGGAKEALRTSTSVGVFHRLSAVNPMWTAITQFTTDYEAVLSPVPFGAWSYADTRLDSVVR